MKRRVTASGCVSPTRAMLHATLSRSRLGRLSVGLALVALALAAFLRLRGDAGVPARSTSERSEPHGPGIVESGTERSDLRLQVEAPQSAAVDRPLSQGYLIARVRGPSSEWAADARVELVIHGWPAGGGATDVVGCFRVAELPTEPTVVFARQGPLLGRALWEPSTTDGTPEPVLVDLRAEGTIAGVVVHGVDRRPMPNARVMAYPAALRPRSLARESRSTFAVEAQADELGRFELFGLTPETEYSIHAAVDGHLTDSVGVRATAITSEMPEAAATIVAVEVLPVFGVLAQFVDAGSGVTLPDTLAQFSNIGVESRPGELITLSGLALDELGLPESVALGTQRDGIRVFLFRVVSIEAPSEPLVLTVDAIGFAPARSVLPVEKLSPQMSAQVVPLFSTLGSHHPVTLRIAGCPGIREPRPPPPYQLHLDSSGLGVRSCFVHLDSNHEVHLALPSGDHRMRFVAGGGAVTLPAGDPGAWLDFNVAGATTVELRWPQYLSGVTLDVREADGFPASGVLSVYWSMESAAEDSPLAASVPRTARAVMFVEPPYWLPNLRPGSYRIWLDKPMSGPGYKVDVPRFDAHESRVHRVRLDRR